MNQIAVGLGAMSPSAQFSVTAAPMSNRTSAYSIPAARKVSPLRQRMIDDMTVRNLAPNTVLCYLKQVNYLARYFGRSPQQVRRQFSGQRLSSFKTSLSD